MFQAFKYRIYPNKTQQKQFAEHFGACRYVYNKCLELKKNAWGNEKKNLSRYELDKMLPNWKKEEETEWLSKSIGQSLQQSIIHLDQAYTRFFREKRGFPKFKNKHQKQSFQIPQFNKLVGSNLKLPKIGLVNTTLHRPIVGEIKTVTISKTTTGKYFASIVCKPEEEVPTKKEVREETTLGIDLGLKDFVTLSNGKKIKNPKFLKRKLKQLKRANRQLSRKQKGSKNRNKSKLKLATIHEKVTNCRKDFLHKVTSELVNENQVDTFCIEDLNVSGMMKNKRLARHIQDVGWTTFNSFLQHKCDRLGKNIIKIGRFEPSSKMCSCGTKNKDLKLSNRTWTCQFCHTTHDRDVLAANNIKKFALHPQNLIGFIGMDHPKFTLEESFNRNSMNQELAIG